MNLFDAFRFSVLSHPWVLLLIVPVAVLLGLEMAARPAGAITISTGEVLRKVRGNRRAVLRRLPALLRAVGLCLLIVAIARPLQGLQANKQRADVIDIMLCVDVSGSMLTEDFVEGRRRINRITVTKEAVRHFLNNRKDRKGDRYGLDRVGLIFYGAYAWTQGPLTLDYGVLEHELDKLVIDKRDAKTQQTAIGSAIGLAVRRLSKSKADSKVIILLTDGINNAGQLDPITAARVAKDYGIRVYTIGAGAPEGGLTRQNTIFGSVLTGSRRQPIDEETLKKIAEATGGKYYRATDRESLQGAYDEINELETTEIEIGDYYEYEEGFVPYVVVGSLVLLASIFSRRQWFEAIP